MAQEVIFAEQTVEGFSSGGLDVIPALFVLTEGESYRVVWDGTEYDCTALDVEGVIMIGNTLPANGVLTDEPFCILYGPVGTLEEENDATSFLAVDVSAGDVDQATSHTVAIYQVVEAETTEGASIVLKDRNGEDVTYTGIKTVTFDTPTEGEQVTFTLGVEQTGLEVELALADGDQQVKADDGKLLKELTIKKPETLLPENIRSGTTVAGVAGEFIGDTEETTVALSMADGDQVVEPSAEGKVLSKLTITKPETLVPENIAAGVDIAGIIGTLTGSGDGPKVISKSFTGSYDLSGIVTLFTADELAQIGFADATNKFVLIMPQSQVFGYNSSFKTLVANFIRTPYFTTGASTIYGMTLYAQLSSGRSTPSVTTVKVWPFGTTARTDTMYYADGAIVYDVTNSTYKLAQDEDTTASYILIACVCD